MRRNVVNLQPSQGIRAVEAGIRVLAVAINGYAAPQRRELTGNELNAAFPRSGRTNLDEDENECNELTHDGFRTRNQSATRWYFTEHVLGVDLCDLELLSAVHKRSAQSYENYEQDVHVHSAALSERALGIVFTTNARYGPVVDRSSGPECPIQSSKLARTRFHNGSRRNFPNGEFAKPARIIADHHQRDVGIESGILG